MSYPSDPQHGQQHYPVQPPHQPYQQQPHHQPYPYAMQQHGHVVSRTGLSPAAHTVHLVLSLLTCFFWSPIWFIHAMLARRKTVTRY